MSILDSFSLRLAALLMFFLLRLFSELQRRGSVPAIDLAAYAQPLERDS